MRSSPPHHKVGFWQSSTEPGLPMPKAEDTPWKDKKVLLEALDSLEAQANVVTYRGFSLCRICGKANGSSEYTYKNFTWPEGYRHYLEAHNVEPDPKFHVLLLAESLA